MVHRILKDFQKKMNSDLSVSSLSGVEKVGVLVVVSASSWSRFQKASGISENVGLE